MSHISISEIELINIRNFEHFKTKCGAVNIILGHNDTGKSTFLDAVMSVFRGGNDISLLRNGCEEGRITFTLSNGYSATKTFRPDGYELVVRTPEGGEKRPAKSFLEDLLPAQTFDPIGFLNKSADERADFLLKSLPVFFAPIELNDLLLTAKGADLVVEPLKKYTDVKPITLVDFDSRFEEIFSTRTKINEIKRDLEGAIATSERGLLESETVDWSAECTRIQAELTETAGKIETSKSGLQYEAEKEKAKSRKGIDDQIAALRKQISELEQKRISKDARIDRVTAELIRKETAGFQEQHAKLSEEFGTARTNADRQQQDAGRKIAIAEDKKRLKNHAVHVEYLTSVIEDLRSKRSAQLAKALPIKGFDLQFKKGKPIITIDGIPLDKRNRATALLIGIKCVVEAQKAIQGNSETVGALFMEGSELDDDTLIELERAVVKAGRQLFITRPIAGAEFEVKTT